jgi:hypothetical protein
MKVIKCDHYTDSISFIDLCNLKMRQICGFRRLSQYDIQYRFIPKELMAS